MMDLTGKKVRTAFKVSCAAVVLLSFCALSFASGGGEHGGAHEGANLSDLLYRAINFVLMVLILFLAIRKTALKKFFRSRREDISKLFEDLKSDKEAAEGKYQELKEKLKAFEEKKGEIIRQFKAEGAVEKERIITEAQERAARILRQADLTIERGIQAARDRLRQEVLDAAARKAREIIAGNIDDRDQDRLVDEFIERVEKLH